jgi:hypothetical protein
MDPQSLFTSGQGSSLTNTQTLTSGITASPISFGGFGGINFNNPPVLAQTSPWLIGGLALAAVVIALVWFKK